MTVTRNFNNILFSLPAFPNPYTMEDELVSCPYNKEHRIIRYRLPYHIIKCKKQYVGTQLHTCPFNAMHLVDKNQMTAHIKECPDYLITVENEMAKTYAPSRTGASSMRTSKATTAQSNGTARQFLTRCGCQLMGVFFFFEQYTQSDNFANFIRKEK